MPIYEYQCSSCFYKFEKKESFNGNPSISCPKCGNKAKRVFSAVPIIFNGPGFYCTDNGHKSSTLGNSTAKSDTGKTSTKADK